MASETITKQEIKRKLAKHYHIKEDVKPLRMFKHVDSHEQVGTIFFSLDGSPPKGYAVYIPELAMVNFYDVHGRRFRKLTSCRVKGLETREEINKSNE